eukprot:217982-Hanusia_phi.AAC.1
MLPAVLLLDPALIAFHGSASCRLARKEVGACTCHGPQQEARGRHFSPSRADEEEEEDPAGGAEEGERGRQRGREEDKEGEGSAADGGRKEEEDKNLVPQDLIRRNQCRHLAFHLLLFLLLLLSFLTQANSAQHPTELVVSFAPSRFPASAFSSSSSEIRSVPDHRHEQAALHISGSNR